MLTLIETDSGSIWFFWKKLNFKFYIHFFISTIWIWLSCIYQIKHSVLTLSLVAVYPWIFTYFVDRTLVADVLTKGILNEQSDYAIEVQKVDTNLVNSQLRIAGIFKLIVLVHKLSQISISCKWIRTRKLFQPQILWAVQFIFGEEEGHSSGFDLRT